ncbi:Sua5/YciO/YrdC/YwlC family protein [soil metagenome]
MTSRYTSIAEQIRRGGVVGYPTESVFGLGCDPHDAAAVARIFELKQRDPGQGFLLIAADLQQIARYIDAAQVPAEVRARVESGWPGPSTWIFPASREVPAWISGRHTGISLRVTAHGPAAALCRAFGGALVSTSANPHGLPPARPAAEVEAYFPGQLAAVLDEPVGTLAQPTIIRDALTGEVVRA